jgi:glycosidase
MSLHASPHRAARSALALCAALLALGTAAAPAAPPSSIEIDTRPLPAKASPSKLAPGWQHSAFIEIFVRAYQDSDGDGIGDLRGLTQRLDYLRELGVRGIWLMPITPSGDRDHGYAAKDFRAVEPQYGSLADFDALIRAAHARGIGVILDYAPNHGADSSPLFSAAAAAPGSPLRDWFVWQDKAPGGSIEGWDIWGKNPWYAAADGSRYLGIFGPEFPDFNLRNPAAVEYHKSSLRFWLNRGLDGFRLDAMTHLVENSAKDWNDQPESRRLSGAFADVIRAYPNRYAVCEATANPQIYAGPKVCGAAFAFGLEQQIIKAAKGDAEAAAAVARYFETAPPTMATMLSNHDRFAGERAWDQFGGDEARYKLAAATYLLLPGTPFIYYGEEIGMAGALGVSGDHPLRSPMSWTAQGGFTSAAQPFRPVAPNAATHNAADAQAQPGSLLGFYKAMLKLRNTLPSIARGSYLAAQADGSALSFQRRWRGERTLVVLNYGNQAREWTAEGLPPKHRLEQLYPGAAEKAEGGLRSDSAGRATLSLPALSVAVFRVHAR